MGGGFGKQLPDDDDQRTLIGAAVFGIILIVLVGAGYYFLVYAPYQDTLTVRRWPRSAKLILTLKEH